MGLLSSYKHTKSNFYPDSHLSDEQKSFPEIEDFPLLQQKEPIFTTSSISKDLPNTPLPEGPDLDVELYPLASSSLRYTNDFVPTDIVVIKKALSLPQKSSKLALSNHRTSQHAAHDTWSKVAFKGLFQFEKFITKRMIAIKGSSQLEEFATIPVTLLQGVKTPEMTKVNNTKIRVTGIVFAFTALFYVTWLVHVLNTAALWLSLPFFLATVYTTALVCITVYNNWHRSSPRLVKVPKGREPLIAVLIPTYGEPVDMLQITIESVLSQEWPNEKLALIIGDDSHRPEVRKMIEAMNRRFPSSSIIYHEPPRKGNPNRRGSAKDGNLNSMFAFVIANYPTIEFIETRDADDIIGDANFLRYSVGHLLTHPQVAYVQTIKEALVSPGDPFGNRQSFFYRGVMLARHASNAVFPCGSGLIWRKKSLQQIGGFPTWNLVEDLYSGYVAMQHGLKGAYVPIVGAIGQVSPEDIPNVYKQLGTWALDTTRIFVWKNPWFTKGLTFQQKMQFAELGMFYLMSFPLLIFVITPIVSLFFGIHPFLASNIDYVLHFWLYAAVIEVLLALLGDNTTFEEIWRARQMWFGMMFVYIKACFLAITYGPNSKPSYKVTRKVQQTGIYIRETLFQILLFLLLLSSVIYNGLAHHDILKEGDIGSMFWVILYMFLLLGIIRRSWFGVKITLLHQHTNRNHSLQASMVKKSDAWQFFRFCLVGSLNAVIDFAVLNALLWKYPTSGNWKILGYNSLAVLLASTNSFFWNKYWTFQKRQSITSQEVFRFVVVAASTVFLSDLLMWQLAGWFPVLMQTTTGSNITKLAAIIGTMSISFFGMRLWVFFQRKQVSPAKANM